MAMCLTVINFFNVNIHRIFLIIRHINKLLFENKRTKAHAYRIDTELSYF